MARSDPQPLSGGTPEHLQAALVALRRAEVAGRPWALCETLARAGRSYRQTGALDAALTMFEQALRWSYVTGSADLTVDVLCELTTTRTQQAEASADDEPGASRTAREAARDHAFEAVHLARHATDLRWEVTVLLRVSDLLDRLGDRDEATLLQARAMQCMAGSSGARAENVEPPSPTRH